MVRGRNRRAADRTLQHLRRMGRLEPLDDAAITALRSLADAVDVPDATAAMWRQYRELLAEMTRSDDDGGDLASVLAAFGSPAEVGDAPPT